MQLDDKDLHLRDKQSRGCPFNNLSGPIYISEYPSYEGKLPHPVTADKTRALCLVPVIFSCLGMKGFCRQWPNVPEMVWKEGLIAPRTKVISMRFAVNIHTHLETLNLMKFTVWLPISYLLNSYLTICSGSNWLNAEGWGGKRDSVSLTRDTKSLRALGAWLLWLNLHSPRQFLSSLYSPRRNPCETYWQWHW